MARQSDVRSLQTLEYVLGADPGVVRGFARAAADHLADKPLTLADRDRLLRRGERLGLKRFDANLVLAAVEHRHRSDHPPMRIVADRARPVNRAGKWTAAAAAVALQGVILTGVWWLLA